MKKDFIEIRKAFTVIFLFIFLLAMVNVICQGVMIEKYSVTPSMGNKINEWLYILVVSGLLNLVLLSKWRR